MKSVRSLLATAALLALVLLQAPAGQAEQVQRDGVRVGFTAELTPPALPRAGTAPVAITLGGRVTPVGAPTPPPLRRIEIGINRNGRLDTRGMPACRLDQIQPATNAEALRECRGSLLGEGRFAAKLLVADQPPFPARGRVLAFYGRDRGERVIFAHVYGTDPVPTSFTLPLRLGEATGRFGTTLATTLEPSLSSSGYITYLRMTIGGKRFGHLRAGCPAPAGVPGGPFPLARLRFEFAGATLASTLVRSCRVRR